MVGSPRKTPGGQGGGGGSSVSLLDVHGARVIALSLRTCGARAYCLFCFVRVSSPIGTSSSSSSWLVLCHHLCIAPITGDHSK